MSCEDIPSLLDLHNTKKHVDDFGRLMGTGTGTSTNEVTGQVRPTYNKVIGGMNNEFNTMIGGMNDEFYTMIGGMNNEFDSQILNMGFTRIGTFAAGATLTNPRQTLLWDIADGGDGQEYGWSGVFPPSGKVVPPGSTPLTTGGIAVGAWMSRFDPALRVQTRESLRRSYAEAGYNLVDGSFEAGGTLVNVNDVLLQERTGKAYSGAGLFPQTVVAGTDPTAGGFTDRALIRPGAGVIRNCRFALRDIVCASDFDVLGDGTDEKANIQKAVDYASSLGGRIELLFEPGKTYVTKGFIPKSGVVINLQGSVLKLADATNTPILFDGGVGNGANFGVINGTLDCNQSSNNGINVLGGVWLTGWTGLRFEGLRIKNCARIGLNLINCSHLKIDDYKFFDSGTGTTHFAYGLNIEGAGSKHITVKNVEVTNVRGFGVHFFGCTDFEASNFKFDNLTWGSNQAIAITFTHTQRGSCNNVDCNLVGGDNIELNGNTDLTLDNYDIKQAGNRALLTGGASYGYNKRVKIRNFHDSGTAGAYSAALTYLTDCEFDNINFEKGVSTLLNLTEQRRNVMRNSTIGSTVSASPALVAYSYFRLENFNFTDYTFRQLNSQVAVVSGVVSPMANGAVINLHFPSIFSTALMTGQGAISGTLKTMTRYTRSFNQGSFQTCHFVVNDFGTAANLSSITQVNNSVTRALVITGDSPNKQIVLTNSSGVDLYVAWTLDAVFQV